MSVSVSDVLEVRAAGLKEHELWSLLHQSALALQDVLFSYGDNDYRKPKMAPSSLQVTWRGRVAFSDWSDAAEEDLFLAPEWVDNQQYADIELEKMWIYVLGRTLQVAMGCRDSPNSISAHFLDVLQRMTQAEQSSRALLVDILTEITNYCKIHNPDEPFYHSVMDMYKEVMGSPPKCLASSNNTNRTQGEIELIYLNTTQSPSTVNKENHMRITRTPSSCSETINGSKSVKRHPVQRAASRLYRAEATEIRTKYSCPRTCIGPEFVVRSSSPIKYIHLDVDAKSVERRNVMVVLLTGQKVELSCNPNTTTVQHVFEAVVKEELIEDNFMFGLSALLDGDMVILPANTRLHKVAPSGWKNATRKEPVHFTFTLYLRVRFFLKDLRGIRSWETKHLLYLQLRRCLLEQQISCTPEQLFSLASLSLQAEFGDFQEEEHGSSDYFILEHYLPERVLNRYEDNMLKEKLQTGHKEKRGLDPGRSEEFFIREVQKLQEYGYHFFPASVVTDDGLEAVLLSISSYGICFHQRNKATDVRDLLLHLPWKIIQKLCCTKNSLSIAAVFTCWMKKPHKYKLRMNSNKNVYVFHLASTLHQFFLKLRNHFGDLQFVSTDFGIPVKIVKKEIVKLTFSTHSEDTRSDVLLKLATPPTTPVNTNRKISPIKKKRQSWSGKKIGLEYNLDETRHEEEDSPEDLQNRKNEHPWASYPRRNNLMGHTSPIKGMDLSETSFRCSSTYSKCLGIRMGTRSCLRSISTLDRPHVVPESIKTTDEKFSLNMHETLSPTLVDRFNNVSCEEERFLTTARIKRDEDGNFGIQVGEGSDGGVYILSVNPNGPAANSGNIHKGDQVIAVNGHSLQSMQFEDALEILKSISTEVELILAQCSTTPTDRMKNYQMAVHKRGYQCELEPITA